MGGGIGQYALYRAGDGSLCLFSLVVPVGAETPVHDHLAWGIVGVYRGTQDETVYRRLDDASVPGRAALEVSKRQALRRGECYTLLPPADDIHFVRTTSDVPSISIHLLANDTACVWRHRFDPAAGTVSPFRSGYVNAPCPRTPCRHSASAARFPCTTLLGQTFRLAARAGRALARVFDGDSGLPALRIIMTTILQNVPVGQRVGIAFSGGLDTSAALHWMRAKGAIPYAYTANLGQPDEPTTTTSRAALQYGAEKARLIDCRRSSSPRGWPRCSAARFTSRRPACPTSTPRRSAAPSPARCWSSDEGRRRPHLGRRQHVQGQRHRAVLSLRSARQPAACGSTSRGSIRRSSTSSAAARKCPSTCASAGFAYRMSAEKAYSTDSNILGATHEAKDLEQLDTRHHNRRADHGRAVLARGRRDQRRKRSRSASRKDGRSRLNGTVVSAIASSCCGRRTPSAAATASA